MVGGGFWQPLITIIGIFTDLQWWPAGKNEERMNCERVCKKKKKKVPMESSNAQMSVIFTVNLAIFFFNLMINKIQLVEINDPSSVVNITLVTIWALIMHSSLIQQGIEKEPSILYF